MTSWREAETNDLIESENNACVAGGSHYVNSTPELEFGYQDFLTSDTSHTHTYETSGLLHSSDQGKAEPSWVEILKVTEDMKIYFENKPIEPLLHHQWFLRHDDSAWV